MNNNVRGTTSSACSKFPGYVSMYIENNGLFPHWCHWFEQKGKSADYLLAATESL